VALKQVELGMPVADLIRKLGISEQTFYRWKKDYSGLESDQAREYKQLQEENARLKRLVARSRTGGLQTPRAPFWSAGI
jgi:putative transposase